MRRLVTTGTFVFSLILAGCAAPGSQNSAPAVAIADGDAATRQVQYRAAIIHYSRAIESGTLTARDLAEAFAKRGTAYWREAGRNEEPDPDLIRALTDFSQARSLFPAHFGAAYGEANVYQALGDYVESLKSFKAAYALDMPTHYWSLIGIGATYRSIGEYETAMRYLDRVLEISGPNSGMPIFYHRGLTFFAARKYREAIESFSTGIPQQRNYTWAYVYRGCSYARLGEYDRAMSDYDAAVEFIRRNQAEYGNSKLWQKLVERFSSERAAVGDMAKGRAAAVPVEKLCEEFAGSVRYRDRSPMLPPVKDTQQLPNLNILPNPTPSGATI